MNNRIKTIVFDYGNVIAKFDVGLFLKGIAPLSQLPLDELKIALSGSSDIFADYETGLMTSDEFFSQLRHACALSATETQFMTAYVSIFSPIETTADLIFKLKPFYKLALLSNTNEWHFQYQIRPNRVFPLFDAVSLSFRVKARKPSEAIYRDLITQLRVDASECVFIDDIREYVDAACALGMVGIQYTSHESLLRSLDEVGVRVD